VEGVREDVVSKEVVGGNMMGGSLLRGKIDAPGNFDVHLRAIHASGRSG
jgi:hypothetical protein